MRRTLLVVTMTLPLCGCGWFGSKSDDQPPPGATAQTSDETLKRDCADEQWKQQNLGLWYSVCRQPMKW